MIPKDLSGFSAEQLRGFAVAVRQRIAELKATQAEGAFTPAQVDEYAAAADDLVRLDEAIQAAADAEGAGDDTTTADADAAVDAAVEGDAEPTDDDETGDGDGEDTPATDAETVVDEAVASATMGGGTGPRVKVGTERDFNSMRKFVQHMAHGNVRAEERHQFTTMRRETNTIVREGANATEAFAEAIAGRAAGTDKTAAGCFCGPDDAINAIKECGDTTRPFSDTLPTVTASGDVKYVRQIDLADALTGVTQWLCADQDAVDPTDPDTWKPCFELECEAEQTSAMYAVSACASFSTQQLIGNPALIANLEHVMEVAFSKTAELLVYNRVRALSSKYVYGLNNLVAYGASAQLLAAVGWGMEAIHANLREKDPNYTLSLPAGLIDRVLTDALIRGIDDYKTRDDLFDRLATLGITNVVELADEIVCSPQGPDAHAALAAPGAGCATAAAVAHPLEQEILLYRPEDFILGVGPDIDLGVQRSPELARQNKLQWFTEGFEFVEKVGCAPALALVVPFCPSGNRPALGVGEDCTP